MRNSSGNGDQVRLCLVCDKPARGRSAYCSDAHRVKAFRLRHRQDLAPRQDAVRADLRRRSRLAAHTVYECQCGERYLGQQQCDQCHRFCRAVGLGGRCHACDEVVLVVDLLDDDLTQLLLGPSRRPS